MPNIGQLLDSLAAVSVKAKSERNLKLELTYGMSLTGSQTDTYRWVGTDFVFE